MLDPLKTLCVEYKSNIKVNHLLQVLPLIVHNIGLGKTSLISTIYFYFFMNSSCPVDEIKKNISQKYFKIVLGLSRVFKLHRKGKNIASNTFRKLLLNFADDIRVILITTAFLLHDLRNLQTFRSQKRNEIVHKVKYLYLPFAHKLGLHRIIMEMEDHILKFEEPDVYNDIQQKLDETSKGRNQYIKEFLIPIHSILDKENFQFTLKSRTKSIASILNKIRTKEVEFEEIFDIFAIRIILDSKPENENKIVGVCIHSSVMYTVQTHNVYGIGYHSKIKWL